MPDTKYGERRAGVCAYLCISIASSETSYISLDDCFAAFSVNRDRTTHPPRKNIGIIPKNVVCRRNGFGIRRMAYGVLRASADLPTVRTLSLPRSLAYLSCLSSYSPFTEIYDRRRKI